MKALIFDLDGTLIDSVYAQVLAWQRSLPWSNIWPYPRGVCMRRSGLDGMLLAPAIARELGRNLGPEAAIALDQRHNELMKELLTHPLALPGAAELLRDLKSEIFFMGSRLRVGALRCKNRFAYLVFRMIR